MKDLFGRELNYVRISVTDRCNYRCCYCMPREGVEWIPHGQIMSYEDIFFLVDSLWKLGVKKVRFTGGEPLIRKGMIPFLEKVRVSFPELQVALTTNGSTLVKDASCLALMRLSGINVSLDTLEAEKFSAMTRGALLRNVLDGIDALVSAGAENVKMNAVLIRGFNDGEVGFLLDYARGKGIILRFIEFMPLDQSVWSKKSFVPFQEVLAALPDSSDWREEHTKAERETLSGPARYYVHNRTGQKVGVISAVSQHFCMSCNRLRVTSIGEVRSCLFSNVQVSIREALRARDGTAVREKFFEAAALKPEVGMTLNRDEQRQMFKIGG